MQNLWDACLRRLEQELPAQQFNTWIRPLSPETDAPSDTLTLTAPIGSCLELVRERFAARIERLAAEASGRELGLTAGARARSRSRCAARASRARGRPPRRPCTSRNARASIAASRSRASSPARPTSSPAPPRCRSPRTRTSYNPLFVYGGVGLGKTHLIQAIGNHILPQRPGREDPLHPRRDVRLRRGARLPAQGVRRVQALLPLARPAADRRHPVLRRQEPHAGGVLLPVQHADRGAQAGRHHLRHLSEGDRRASRSG